VTLDGSGSSGQNGASIASYAWAITSGSSLASFSGSTTGSTATLVTSAAGSVTVHADRHRQPGDLRQRVPDAHRHRGPVRSAVAAAAPGLWWQCGLLALGLLLRRRSA
jgi:serine protease